MVGYGEHPPLIRWTDEAKVAVQLVVNYEEGSGGSTPWAMTPNDILYELPFALEGQRNLAVESMYEYGSRAASGGCSGYWMTPEFRSPCFLPRR